MVSVILVVGIEEEDGGDDRSDLDQVGVVWLAVFDLEVFLCHPEEGGKLFRSHGVRASLLVLS